MTMKKCPVVGEVRVHDYVYLHLDNNVTSLLVSVESSAGLLMTGLYDGPSLDEETDLFEGELSNESSTYVSPSNSRRRNRSGSCSEYMFGLRQNHNSQGSPQSPRSPDSNSPSECFKLLIR